MWRGAGVNHFPIRPGTARRLGIRHPYQGFRRRFIVGPDIPEADVRRLVEAFDRGRYLASVGVFRPVTHMGGQG